MLDVIAQVPALDREVPLGISPTAFPVETAIFPADALFNDSSIFARLITETVGLGRVLGEFCSGKKRSGFKACS